MRGRRFWPPTVLNLFTFVPPFNVFKRGVLLSEKPPLLMLDSVSRNCPIPSSSRGRGSFQSCVERRQTRLSVSE
jgi:hypothetical protein